MNNDLRAVIEGLNMKIKEEGLTITKAVKGNAVLLMERSSYLAKVYVVLDSCGDKENKDFCFLSHIKEVRKVINNSRFLINNESERSCLFQILHLL